MASQKKFFDRKAIATIFRRGDLVVKWDVDRAKPRRHSKFDIIWSGTYVITSCKKGNAFQLSKPNGDVLSILVNGIYIKPCF